MLCDYRFLANKFVFSDVPRFNTTINSYYGLERAMGLGNTVESLFIAILKI